VQRFFYSNGIPRAFALTIGASYLPLEVNLGLRNYFGAGKVLTLQCAPVAQLDRVSDYESEGRKFESCRAHHKSFIPL
jgi:hypothetical protein